MEPICPNRFYSSKVQKRLPSKSKFGWVKQHRVMPSHILSPTQYWKEFYRQADALATAIEDSTKTDTLCTFVYEQALNGNRKFVVAHPEVYWWYYTIKPPKERCSYEIIPKNSPCWLYLDLEYPFDLNPLCNGPRMTMILIDIIRAYLLNHYHLLCERSNFLILDSTSTKKFSRHVIFTLKDMAFKDNSHVGRFIKTICNDILFYLKSNISTHGILNHFNKADIQEMLVMTQRGEKLFVDTGVYTKNRHFRLYLSTKWGKQSYLTVSDDCVHNTVNKCKEKELGIFLDSLISYFPNKQNLILLEFVNRSDVKAQLYSKIPMQFTPEDDNQTSPYPEIDRYIRSLIDPGKIRIVRYSDKTKTLKYEIYGNRYCENIGKYHKSNNVYWIVDLNIKQIYQKCHDPDCSDFTSTPKNLPEEILFKLDTDGDTFLASLIDEDIMEKM
ncbi:DNA-directed primase/polymerase protein [Solenopsis invicta]|uniref:DNA-directed primase/polymerase protein n=1 Tax=Solenopsis invicta TaxID=13686 RepID=UPI00193DCA28|nr:DNA-directed primase/polymerase protein [Solenopsis invicta]XP_011156786.2 DNA-directed primase/polymerase protein [Solenopsis invicta]XP_039314870.1 DNA-directed primase/polymerase protein [Solenopsis invicta]